MIKKFLNLTVCCLITVMAYGQKQPKVQQGSVRAPDNIKIDGKTTEWNDKFQAYNNANRIFYTLSNDDEHLYLAVKVTDQTAINKIITGGIALELRIPDAKGKALECAILFPELDLIHMEDIHVDVRTYGHYTNDTLANKGKIDSVLKIANEHIYEGAKNIGITGINEITDPEISIYNTEGIKAVGLFNSGMVYTYELAIPLKCLGLTVNSGKFKYNIRLSGTPVASVTKGTSQVMFNGPITDPVFLYTNTPTNVGGEYVLVKK